MTFMNNVVITTVGQIKIYSWDDLGGGSYHSTRTIQNGRRNCFTKQLDTNEHDSEVGY